jgi:hypothetical protein
MHAAAMHTSPTPQDASHAPQCIESMRVSTQAPAQSVALPAHAQTPPPAHTSPDVQSPQLPPHVSSPHVRPAHAGMQPASGMSTTHAPALHRSDASHIVPQAPQFAESTRTSTQLPPQSLRPPLQSQLPPAPQTRPPLHVPQLPPHPSSPQVRPVQSGVHTHEPPVHASMAAQTIPQPPQWFRLLLVLTQLPPQSVRPAAQTHAPAASHVRPDGHVPHEPPHPSSPHATPVQSGMHDATHVPLMHVWPAPHVPHDPPQPSPPQVRPPQLGVHAPQTAGRVASQSEPQPMPNEPVVG